MIKPIALLTAIASSFAAPISPPLSFLSFDLTQGDTSPLRVDQGLPTYNYCEAAAPEESSYESIPNYELAHVQVSIRHGDRVGFRPQYFREANFSCAAEVTSSISGPNTSGLKTIQKFHADKTKGYAKEYFWNGNCNTGALTLKGHEQHVDLGSKLRGIYVKKMKFLPETLSEAQGNMWVKSTNLPRTQQSGASLLSGLFPPESRSDSDAPIEFHTQPWELETVEGNSAHCPLYARLSNEYFQSGLYQQYLDSFKSSEIRPLLETLYPGADKDPEMVKSINLVADDLYIRTCQKIEFPCNTNSCVTPAIASKVSDMRHNEYRLSFRDTPKEMKRLAGGVILGEWRDAVDGFLNGVESEEWRGYDKRFRLLSGHDTTLANMLGNLELLSGTQFVQPGYRSQLIFEIWKPVAAVSDSSEPMLRIIYNSKVLKIPFCESKEMCEWSRVMAFLEPIVPKDLVAECKI